MNIYKVIGWTDYTNTKYPESGDSIAIFYAIIKELQEKGYKFGGDAHQEKDGCCPVMNDGTIARFSMRGRGGLMATALGEYTDENAYMEWCMDGFTRKGKVGSGGIRRESVYPHPFVDETSIPDVLRGKRIHTMHLTENPYRNMERGLKTLEIRLNDEKRQEVRVGDIIEFCYYEGEMNILITEVEELHRFKSFRGLFESDMAEMTGMGDMSVEEAVKAMYVYYTKEKEDKYGVLGIKIKLLS